MDALRPIGGEIYLDLKELGAVGWATVNAILPCPEIEPGEGTVVTGTFKHQANEQTRVLRLALEGQHETTGVTDNHPYWSVDRQEFIPAGNLVVGETVDTVSGERRVESVTPIAADAPTFDGYLYNLETTEHVYRVGTLATLVHNKGASERVDPSGAVDLFSPLRGKSLSSLTAKEVGNIGEDVARRLLGENGWTDIIAIQTRSGNGIDVVAHASDGRLVFFEVNSSRIGQIRQLSTRQLSMTNFIEDVLSQASTGTGRYRHLDAASQDTASRLFREFRRDPLNVSAYAVGVDLLNEIIRISPWR